MAIWPVVGGVEVEDAVLHQAQADRLPVVVQDGDPALVLGLPGHRPRVAHRVRVLVHQVLAPGDPGRVDRVRHRVLPALVVEGVGEVGPGLGDVRDIGVVERLDQLGLDELAEHVDGGADQHVVTQAAAQLGHRLVHGVERGDLHLELVLLGEGVDDGLVDVGDPGVDLQGGAGLGGQVRGDGGVSRENGPFDRVVRAGQRDGAGAGQGGGARVEQRGGAEGRQRRARRCRRKDLRVSFLGTPWPCQPSLGCAIGSVPGSSASGLRPGRRRRSSRQGGRCPPRRAAPR